MTSPICVHFIRIVQRTLKMNSNLQREEMTESDFNENYTGCPKKMYTHKVNIPYYNVYIYFWNILYRPFVLILGVVRSADLLCGVTRMTHNVYESCQKTVNYREQLRIIYKPNLLPLWMGTVGRVPDYITAQAIRTDTCMCVCVFFPD
jgi:hypothetical protein